MKKIIGFSVLALILGLLVACDALIAPLRGRENPLDSSSPVRNYNAFAVASDQVRVVFDEADWTDEGRPRALWIFVRMGSAVTAVDDSHDYKYWYWWDDGQGWEGIDHYFDAVHTLNGSFPAEQYFISAFWTYDDVSEGDDGADWLGPVTDVVGFEEHTLVLYPSVDGYSQDGYGNVFDSSDGAMDEHKELCISMNGTIDTVSIVDFDLSEVPPVVARADLTLSYKYRDTLETFPAEGVFEILTLDWTTTTDYSTFRDDGSFWTGDSVPYRLEGGYTEPQEFSFNIMPLMAFWREGGGTGLMINHNQGEVYFYSSEATPEDDYPRLEITYYGSGE